MINFLYLLFILLYMGASAGSCLLAYQIYKKFNQVFLASFFYYLLCCTIFCTYSIIGPILIKEIILDIEEQTIILNIVSYFITFLGIPFLLISWFMLIKFSVEFTNQKVSTYFSYAYFFITLLILFACGLFVKYLGKDFAIDFEFIKYRIVYIFAIVETSTLLIVLYRLNFLKSKKNDLNRRKQITLFSKLTAFGHAISIIFLIFSIKYPIIAALFILSYVSRNIGPVIKLREYLNTNIPTINELEDEEAVLEKLCAAYQISAREKEIILKIDEGKSNKEISEELFISLQTVKDHIYRIFQKTGVKSRIQLSNMFKNPSY